MAKDAHGHGSNGRGGGYVGGRIASLGAALTGNATHQTGVGMVPRGEALRQWRDEGTSNDQVTRGIRALFGVGEYKGK